MVFCSAINCANSTKKGFRLFRFPNDEERKRRWIVNCRRNLWTPGPGARLCEVHFEDSQFELNRKDKWKKLKQNAIPTLFNVPNPPLEISNKRIKGIGLPKPGTILDVKRIKSQHGFTEENEEKNPDVLLKQIAILKEENRALQESIKERDAQCLKFLSCEQIAALGKSPQSHWSDASIIQGLKFRFALGKNGLSYLKSTGYPIPSYSTLNRRIQNIEIDFGIINIIFALLSTKIGVMDVQDRNCCVLLDEMEIAHHQDFDASSKSFIGNTTLGKEGIANHYLVVMLRGLKSKWKQTVAHELTGPSTTGVEMKKIITAVMDAAKNIGINVKAMTSDMGSSNRALWKSLGVSVKRKKRESTFKIENLSDSNIHTMADVPHVLKNVRNAFLTRIIILPKSVCEEHNLPVNKVSSGFVKQLWITEIDSNSSLRSLHHLNKNHLFPTHFNTMNVALAVQLLSTKTAAALEKAVSLRQIAREALTTAWWLRFMSQWFSVMTARHRKVGITKRNQQRKIEFLQYFIKVTEESQFGKGWKPVQTGMIISTLSVINLTSELFAQGFDFFLPGRLTQDALENTFSQIRRKSGSKPTALQAKRALKLISISQFISDVKNSSYASDTDFHLLDFSQLNLSLPLDTQSTIQPDATSNDLQIPSSDFQIQSVSADLQNPPTSTDFQKPSTSADVQNSFTSAHLPKPSTSADVQDPLALSSDCISNAAKENDIYYIAGATLNALLKRKNLCDICITSLKEVKDLSEPNVPPHRTFLTDYSNMGGLQMPESGIYRVCKETEKMFQKFKKELLASKKLIDNSFINDIKINCRHVKFPSCCKLLENIINYYLVVRCKGLVNHIVNKQAYEKSFGSASANKKSRKN